MEILTEINDIRKMMGLSLINEENVASEIIINLLNKTFKNILKDEEKSLIRKFIASPEKMVGKSGKDFETFIKSENGIKFINEVDKNIIKNPNISAIKKLKAQSLLDSIRNFKSQGGVVTKKLIKNTMEDLEKSYPTLFQKKWYGSFVNQGKIDSITKQVMRDFKGKSAKDIETLIEKKLSDAESKLSKIKNPKKNTYQKLLKRYREYMIQNPVIGSVKTFGFGTIVYLLYYIIINSIETGSPISGTIKTGSDVLWGDIKTGYYSSKSYPNTPNGLLLYLTDKYGPNDYQNNFKLNPPVGGVVTITPISGGETKSFKHNGKTFVEL